MTTPNLAEACITDLQDKMRSVDAFKNKVIFAYTQDDLYDLGMQLQFPCAGILYEGMRSKQDSETKNVAKGYSVDVNFTLLLLVSGKTIGNADYKITALGILEQFRNAIKGTKSPSGNFWQFLIESAVESRAGTFAYAQRFSTPAILGNFKN